MGGDDGGFDDGGFDDGGFEDEAPAAGGRASAGGAAGRAGRGGKAKATSTGTAKKARATGTNKQVKGGKAKGGKAKGGKAKGKKKATGLMAPGPGGIPMWGFAAGGAGLLFLVVILGVALSGGEPEPEPTPEPTPPEELEDIAIATPPPPEPTPEPVEEVTPPPMEQFFSKASFNHHQASAVSAQLTSYAKSNVRIVYTVVHENPGIGHSLTFQGRFTLQLSDGGGSVAGKGFKASLEPGKPTKVDLRYDGKRLTVRVGGKRAGSWGITDPGGFPKWKFQMDAGVKIQNLRASAQVAAE